MCNHGNISNFIDVSSRARAAELTRLFVVIAVVLMIKKSRMSQGSAYLKLVKKATGASAKSFWTAQTLSRTGITEAVLDGNMFISPT